MPDNPQVTDEAPEQIASRIVEGLSFSSNRMVNGRLVGEQYFAAMAIAEAIRLERERLAPDGYVLMPKEPTEAMIEAARNNGFEGNDDHVRSDWSAMLAAAQEQNDASN